MEAMMIASTAFKAVGAISDGNAESASLRDQAAAERYNALVNRINAEQAMREAGSAEELRRRQGRQALGAMRAGAAQAGTGGTYAGVIRQSAVAAELDALNERYRGQSEARAFRQQAVGQEFRAAGLKRASKQAQRAGFLRAGAELVSGAADYTKSKGGG